MNGRTFKDENELTRQLIVSPVSLPSLPPLSLSLHTARATDNAPYSVHIHRNYSLASKEIRSTRLLNSNDSGKGLLQRGMAGQDQRERAMKEVSGVTGKLIGTNFFCLCSILSILQYNENRSLSPNFARGRVR